MLKRALVAVMLFVAPLWARNEFGVQDGSDWHKWSFDFKVGWIEGYVSGMSDAQMGVAVLCAFQLKLPSDSSELKACTERTQSFNYEMIKYGQYLDGMDAFYKDFRNLDYPINSAIRIVRDQVRGRPADDIEKELVAWRQCHADKTKCGVPGSTDKPAPPSPPPK